MKTRLLNIGQRAIRPVATHRYFLRSIKFIVNSLLFGQYARLRNIYKHRIVEPRRKPTGEKKYFLSVPRDDLDAIFHTVQQHLVQLEVPLVLITEIQRSGGTFLSQLFDGHPQCHAHPHELRIGRPDKYTWPQLDLSLTASQLFAELYEYPTIRLFTNGYRKHATHTDTFRFLLPPSIQRRVFSSIIDQTERPLTQRKVINAYMTSYFNSWLDYSGGFDDTKFITAFAAGMYFSRSSIDRYFETYPDGTVISIVRDPRDWYPSAKAHVQYGMQQAKFGELTAAMSWWNRSTSEMLNKKKRYKEKLIIVRFDHLIKNTRDVMEKLTATIGIDFYPILLIPTFNSQPIKPSSSFHTDVNSGILKDVLDRRDTLTKKERTYIDSVSLPLFREALHHADI